MVHPEIVFYISFKTYKRFVHAIKIICLEMIVFLFINVFLQNYIFHVKVTTVE